MDHQTIVLEIAEIIKKITFGESTGHDWFHIERVWKTAKQIAIQENANVFITEIGALLHDIADHKFVDNPDELAKERSLEILSSFDLEVSEIKEIQHIILNCSFKGGVAASKMQSLEGKIVQDADKLDAIGAIGIARTFAFGGKFGSVLYDPNIPPVEHKTLESYQKNRSHTINHFYEKLLKLKDIMHTDSSREIANERHAFMEQFLDQFYKEWNTNLN